MRAWCRGANPFTNKNLSLSTESYERFLEINGQLADLFPSLTKNYDENGNAILGLSGDVDTVTASITRLVEQQNNLTKVKMAEQLEGYVEGTDGNDGIFRVLDGQKSEINDAQNRLAELQNTYNSIINGQGIDSYHVNFNKLELSGSDMEKITDSYNTFYQSLQTDLSVKQSELKAKNQEMSDMMMTWVEDIDLYKDGDADFQKAVELLVGSIQWSELDVGDGDIGAAKQLIQSQVFSPLAAACDDPDTKSRLMDALNNLFTLDYSEMPYKDAIYSYRHLTSRQR